jgi:hypothetical protein
MPKACRVVEFDWLKARFLQQVRVHHGDSVIPW